MSCYFIYKIWAYVIWFFYLFYFIIFFFPELNLVPIPDEQNDIFDSDNNPVCVSDRISTSDPSECAL